MKFGDLDLPHIDDLLDEYDETMTVDQVAELLKVSREVVWGLLATTDRNGKENEDPMPGYKIGKAWVIVREDLKEWLLRHRNTTR